MSFFHIRLFGVHTPPHALDAAPEKNRQTNQTDAGEARLALLVLLAVTALLLWSIASKPLQFFPAGEDGSRPCIYFGRAGASCSAERPEAPQPRR
jgi:hypothetical protein